jgi:hypothetical protein
MVYTEQRYVSRMMRIKRNALLPDSAIGSIQTTEGQAVDVRDKVVRGMIPARHIIINAAAELGLKNPAELGELLLVEMRRPVEKGTAIAGKDPNRGRRVFSPINGLVIYVNDGLIVMQHLPQIVTIEAGVRGRITRVHPGRGVTIETTGVCLQGVWGNDRNAIGTLRFEPPEGLISIRREELDVSYKGDIMITRNALTADDLELGVVQGFAGMIVPCMDASLVSAALKVSFPVMVLSGFGSLRMTAAALQLLEELEGMPVVLDAATPRRFQVRRPEMVVTRPVTQDNPVQVQEMVLLEVGMKVRISREPHFGLVGRVTDLPNQPLLLDNGLRVPCARVEIMVGEIVDIPLANLELAGG